jgi:serine acetyltransferase
VPHYAKELQLVVIKGKAGLKMAKLFFTKIGNNVWIGPNCVLGGPVEVGDHVLIGANSVVTKDIPSNSMVIGFNRLTSRKIVVDNVNNTCSEMGVSTLV